MKTITRLVILITIFIIISIIVSMLNSANVKILPLLSALIGAGFAYFGTWLNNIWSDKRSSKDRKNAILLASLDRRLVAHQEAYNYLRKLFKTANVDWDGGSRKTKLKSIIDDAQDFWEKNTLFISEEATMYFHLFISSLTVYNIENVSQAEREITEKYLLNTGRAIKQGVEIYLPDKLLIEELKG